MTQPKIKATAIAAITTGNVAPIDSDVLTAQRYVDDNDFNNYGPKAGQGSDSTVPVYSDFKFALGTWGPNAFNVIDNQARQVIYYGATSPVDNQRFFRAYRYNDQQSYIFDNDPLSLPFLNPGEVLRGIINAGTYFLTVTTGSRILVVKTNGSSDWREWVLGYDVTALANAVSTPNFGLVSTTSGERVTRLSIQSGATVLDVYDSALTLLRSQTLLTFATEIDITDYSGQGKTVTRISGPGYNPYGYMTAFAWHPTLQTFITQWHNYTPATLPGGQVVDGDCALTISWTIPATWFATGAGTPTNNIPIKNSTYRYHQQSDATWDTYDGGMSNYFGGSGVSSAFVVDEYSGKTLMSHHPTFTAVTAGTHYRLPASYVIHTVYSGTANAAETALYVTIPDGSPWSKGTQAGMINGSNYVFIGDSTRYGARWISATFSTSAFSSVVTLNDTLKLDSPTALLDPQSGQVGVPTIVNNNFDLTYFGSTNNAGTPVRYWIKDGAAIHTETVSGVNLTYTPTSVVLPAVPATVSGVPISNVAQFVWNGSTSSPVVWAVAYGNTNLMRILKWSGTTWSVVGTAQASTEIAAGNSARGDTANLWYHTGSGLLTASGKYLFYFTIPYIGGSNQYNLVYDTNTDTGTTQDGYAYLPTGVNGAGQYNGYGPSNLGSRTFGYSSTFGYYSIAAGVQTYTSAVVSSRNVETAATITEAQWIANSATRPQKFFTTEAATGLIAYLVEFPILIGGYQTKTPNTSVSLQPSTTNYIYVTKTPGDRTSVSVSVSTAVLPASFSRMLIAAVTTNATQVVSSVQYPYNGFGDTNTSLRTISAASAVVAGDRNGYISVTSASTAITVPADATIAIGTKVTVFIGAVTGCTVVPGSGATLRWMGSGAGVTGTRSLAQYAMFDLVKITQTDWLIVGQGIS